jgi:hypothetical protein
MSPFDLPKRTTTLTNTYKPNLNDPRVPKKIAKVLEWCGELHLARKPKTYTAKKLIGIFGNYAQPGLSQWLYANLLRQTGTYAVGKHAYAYSLKEEGYLKLYAMIDKQPPSAVAMAKVVYAKILSGEALPEYSDEGGRRWHAMQNLRREDRRALCPGWYDYDIDACAPTLLHQYVLRFVENSTRFPALARMAYEKSSVREHVANLIKLDVDAAKQLLQVFLFKGHVTLRDDCAVFKAMERSTSAYIRFVNDPYLIELKAELKEMWRILCKRYRDECKLKGNPTTLRYGKLRNRIYIELERQVMDAFASFFPTGEVPGVIMHDGFFTMNEIPADELVAHVQAKTGYAIKMKMERFPLSSVEAVNDPDGTVKREAA